MKVKSILLTLLKLNFPRKKSIIKEIERFVYQRNLITAAQQLRRDKYRCRLGVVFGVMNF